MAALIGASAAIMASTGCRSQPVVNDPMADVRDARLGERRRIAAVHDLWARVESGELDRMAVREDLKGVAWSPAWPVALRLATLEAMASDSSPEGLADTRNMIRLMIPREPEPEVTAYLARTAAGRGWQEATPALIRSLARQHPGVLDTERPEYEALAALNPGRSVEAIAYELFLAPDGETGPRAIATPERIRADAWDLLGRLDRDGTMRAGLVLEGDGGRPGPIADMQALLRDMRTLPLTGEELHWLTRMRDFRENSNRQWWAATSSAVASLSHEQTGRLAMRHLEPIRWANQHRPAWIAATRDELLDVLRARLEGRRFHRRAPRPGERPVPDRLADWQDDLGWGDLLTILIVDEALQQPQVIEALFAQGERDRRDRTAEYGGLLRARRGPEGPGGATFGAILYPPRQVNRRGDHEFVAPTDLIEQGTHALAHYHFHVQEIRNIEYAGPSPGDFAYAARFGRACVVLTGVGTGALNADYFQPDGVVIDLGTLRQ